MGLGFKNARVEHIRVPLNDMSSYVWSRNEFSLVPGITKAACHATDTQGAISASRKAQNDRDCLRRLICTKCSGEQVIDGRRCSNLSATREDIEFNRERRPRICSR